MTSLTNLEAVSRPTVGVQAAVFRRSKILLQRRANVFGDGQWGLPGGHLEFGESFEDAAVRELAEECGIRATQLRTVLPHNTPYERTHYVQIAVEALDWHGNPWIREPDRCSDLRFFALNELPQPLFEPSTHILDHFRSRSNTDAVDERLSLSLSLPDANGVPVKRIAILLLLGRSGFAVQRLFTVDRRKPRRSTFGRFPDTESAWEWLRTVLERRVNEGYVVQECRGDAALDRVIDSFPDSHPVALKSLRPSPSRASNPHQLGLFPEHFGW